MLLYYSQCVVCMSQSELFMTSVKSSAGLSTPAEPSSVKFGGQSGSSCNKSQQTDAETRTQPQSWTAKPDAGDRSRHELD